MHTHYKHAHTRLCVFNCLEGKDVLVVKLDTSNCVIVGGTFDKLVEQLACEEKPGKCL